MSEICNLHKKKISGKEYWYESKRIGDTIKTIYRGKVSSPNTDILSALEKIELEKVKKLKRDSELTSEKILIELNKIKSV